MENVRSELIIAEERYNTFFENIPGATALYKGKDMEIVMVNDTMLTFWGKNRSVLGKSLAEAVPELKDQPFIPLLQEVFLTGTTYSSKEAAAELIVNGQLQTFYFDFTYRALRNEAGQVEGIIHSATDVTELVLARLQMAESDERLNFSLQSAGIGTWNVDVERDVMILDRFAGDLFQACSLVIPFEQTLKNVHPDDVRAVYHAFIDCLQGENEMKCDMRFRMITPAGKLSWLQCTGEVVLNPDHSVQRFGGIVKDVSKEVAGTEAKLRLQGQKDNFLSIASHELKTPVTSIKAYAQLLERMLNKAGDTRNADMVVRLTSQVNRLTTLLDDLLDVSKISNNRLSFKRDYHIFSDIVVDTVNNLDLQPGNHHIHLDLCFMGNLYCDRARIGQVIGNLISNAIKYSPGGDRIEIRTIQSGTEVIFSITDFGIGISQENTKRIFEQFYRVSTAEAYSYQGMGLGLFIAAEIIGQESGRIWVESKEQQGSTFFFALPLSSTIR